MVVFLSVSPFSSVSYFGAPWLGAYRLRSVKWFCLFVCFLMYCPLYHFKMSIFACSYLCYFEIYFVRCKYVYISFSVDALCLENHFSPFHFKSLHLQFRCVSWRQHIVGFCFLIQSDTFCAFLWPVPLYWWIQFIYIEDIYWCMKISYNQLISLFFFGSSVPSLVLSICVSVCVFVCLFGGIWYFSLFLLFKTYTSVLFFLCVYMVTIRFMK